ncbi:hypothetical protein [Paenibacillus segetis]|uniref:Uncharacterized protein n=1 Tax=Paenibacillus segetis TaxID=1325360 RepID=A0ABQ1YHJ0_9BACL|nr:hypothetical protein [Paenibacillus segetis]GGH24692.1 hypothetical protein GCM10008013_24580 [Paenibacillus segetis]
MSERLSRMERHGRSHSNRTHKKEVASVATVDIEGQREQEKEIMDRIQQEEAEYVMSLSRREQAATQSDESLEDLPSRRELYPSQRLKLTRWFFNSLLVVFVVIMIALLWWGISDSPWGQYYDNVK